MQIVLAVLVQLVFTAMVYGPTGAYLTELFPPQIRYTGLSVSYHVGTGVFGGFTPLIALSLTTGTGHQLAGLIYPVAMTAVAALVGAVLLRGGRHNRTVERAWAQFAPVPARPRTRAELRPAPVAEARWCTGRAIGHESRHQVRGGGGRTREGEDMVVPGRVGVERLEFGIAVLGGPTTVIDIAGRGWWSTPPSIRRGTRAT